MGRTTMRKMTKCLGLVFAGCAMLLVVGGGCTKEEASDTLTKAEEAGEEAAATIADKSKEVVEKGGELAQKLGEKATAYLTPLKEKLGNLEGLKDKPEELKKAVTELIQSIEDKSEDVKLPESVSKTLATVKEKLVALKNYLDGKVDQAKIEEHIQEIQESIKSGLGLSS